MAHKTGTSYAGFSYRYYFFGWRDDTVDESNSWDLVTFNHSPSRGQGDNGGPFRLIKRTVTYTGDSFGPEDGYIGILSCNGPYGSLPNTQNPILLSDTRMNEEGSRGFNLTAPTKPKANLASFIGEAREGLPAIVGHQTWRARAAHARSAGSEYLNVEFGWKPLISDIQKFAHSVNNAHQIIKSYRKDSDSKIRRRCDLGSIDEVERYSGMQVSAPSRVFGLLPGETTVRLTDKTWFSGAFRYHVPVSDTQMGKFQTYASNAQHLLGIKITPEVLWNISPWTWAADWFANTGTVLSNISALGTDGLVMQYGYVMHESIRTVTSSCRRTPSIHGDGRGGAKVEQIKYCQRLPASPFGFGVDLDSLSGKQIAVLAALGLSRR